MNPEQQDRVIVVLVRARNPGNIGAAARAMHDFGFSRLRVVNDFPVPFEAAKSAVDASEVMQGATVCGSVAEAVADCTIVVGTTAVGERDLQHELLTLAAARPRMVQQAAGGGQVALLFGSEKTGLSNEELSHCHWLLTIPMFQHAGVRHPSMNLGQAVAVCLYELVREEHVPLKLDPPIRQPAPAAELERLTLLLHQVLEQTGYLRHHPANSQPSDLRRIILRMGAEAREAQLWMGMLRQVLWKLRNGIQEGS